MISWPLLMGAVSASALPDNSYTGWTPAEISPVAWFDAQSSGTMTLSGSLVSAWASRVATCAALTNYSTMPTYTADLFGAGYPGVHFNSDASMWNKAAFASNIGASATIVSLWMPDSASITGRAAPFVGSSWYKNGMGIGSESGASESRSYIWGDSEIYNAVTGNRIDVLTLDSGTSFKLVTNGSLEVSDTVSGVSLKKGFHLGGTGGYQWGHMNLAETLVFNYVLSTAERQKVEGYLAHRWGMTSLLSSSHPYKDVAPT